MSSSENQGHSLREEVFQETQGRVDTQEVYPNLWMYLETVPFMADTEFWDEARKNFSPALQEYLHETLTQPFQPEVILFADKSQTARDIFDLLLAHGVTMRVLPTDDNIQEPTIGWINFDAVTGLLKGIAGATQMISLREAIHTSFAQAIDSIFQDTPPNQVVVSIHHEIRAIQTALAQREMARIHDV